ncbi:hypothetical protein CIRG_04863 [Coccidioides immitis RMSCC 2394]|uniref:Uncharacterized protein n=1 Tax=Coccidioides immitis RMSCC 2394 TaxID=404692 RepID=A0A0J7B5L5_COCIT|nr:hypothetical protein CIRG_04863 [Coccidioides immitis RMSCC 2394]
MGRAPSMPTVRQLAELATTSPSPAELAKRSPPPMTGFTRAITKTHDNISANANFRHMHSMTVFTVQSEVKRSVVDFGNDRRGRFIEPGRVGHFLSRRGNEC